MEYIRRRHKRPLTPIKEEKRNNDVDAVLSESLIASTVSIHESQSLEANCLQSLTSYTVFSESLMTSAVRIHKYI